MCGGLLAHWGRVATTQHAQNGHRVDPQRPARHQRDHDGAQPDAAPATAPSAKTATTAIVITATAQIYTTLSLFPRWLALAFAGALLIAIGARLEWVRERGRDTEEWFQTLR